MRYQWTDREREFVLEGDGSLYEVDKDGAGPQSGEAPAFVAREIIRLAERVKLLEAGVHINVHRDLRRAEESAVKLADRVRELEGRPFDKIAADRLADEVAALVTNRHLDSRSAAADALLDYREPPRTERSDRIAALEAENAGLKEQLRAYDAACAHPDMIVTHEGPLDA